MEPTITFLAGVAIAVVGLYAMLTGVVALWDGVKGRLLRPAMALLTAVGLIVLSIGGGMALPFLPFVSQ